MTWKQKLLAAAILAGMAVVQFYTASLENDTFDEGAHIAAGMSYWATGDYRLNLEHPPLAKLLFVIPLMAAGLRFDTANPHWTQPDQVALGRDFLYRSRLSADTILSLARSVTIAFTVLLGAAIAWWTTRRYGANAALFALAVFALDPTVIAHGRYATTDIPVACLSFLSVIAWIEWLESGRPRWLAAAALLFALAAVTKFSALYALPVHAATAILRREFRKGALGLAAIAAVTAFVASAAYGPAGLAAQGPENFPPGHPYLTGLRTLREHNEAGHSAYLLGSLVQGGRWQYFPIAFALKTPLATLALIAMAIATGRRIPGAWMLLAYPAAYFAISMASNINIGVRHLLPVSPFLFVTIGATFAIARPYLRYVAFAALAAIAMENARVFPDYLAFFNAAAGGKDAGPRYLLDSNLDWGQDVKKLARYLEANHVDRASVALFTNAPPAYYGIRAMDLPVIPAELPATKGWIAISVTELHDVYRPTQPRYTWLRTQRPTARIGGSIYVFRK
ncbi:MAG: glycosyltransferase family 39 protein [Bryobacteraceae bacterium]